MHAQMQQGPASQLLHLSCLCKGPKHYICNAFTWKLFMRHALAQVRHPRVSAEDNDKFLDLMEAYFADEKAAKQDTRPELSFQVCMCL